MPMKPNDFDDLGKVTDHLNLVLHRVKWDETKYKAMVKYLSDRRFLVNCEGLVIAEIYKFGKDGKIDLKADPIYVRLHDVLQLDTYIDCFGEQSVPFRALQYLEVDPTMNGSKAPQEENSSGLLTQLEGDVNRLSAELVILKNEKKVLQKRNYDIEEANKKLTADLDGKTLTISNLKSMNKNLEGNISKTTINLTGQTNKVADLESRIKILEGNAKMMQANKVADLESRVKILVSNAKMMTANLANQTNKVADLESKNKTIKGNAMKTTAYLAAQTNKIVDLETKNKTLESSITNAKIYLATRNNIVVGFESRIKALEGNVTKLTTDLAKRTCELNASRQELNRVKCVPRRFG